MVVGMGSSSFLRPLSSGSGGRVQAQALVCSEQEVFSIE